MRVHHLAIANFRGIKSLDWYPRPGLNCLIGPGDSGKTTILDAISVALAHRWNVVFDDSDFHGGTPTEPISIEVTLTDLDDASLSLDAFGECLRGIDEGGSLLDEPADGTMPAVTVRLTVDRNLEPEWSLIRGPEFEPRRISARQRQYFMAHRIDDAATDHLTWSRTSALARGTAAAPDLPGILADSQRAARQAVFDSPEPSLQQGATGAAAAAAATAAASLASPRPGLDPALHLRSGSIVLHDGDLPVATRGLGSRRLTSLAVQRWATGGSGILLIDELESGLEPHRVRSLVQILRRGEPEEKMQVFCTTHSPTVIEEADVTELVIARVDDTGTASLCSVAPPDEDAGDWQALARYNASALLSKQIAVGEGATEVGVLRTLIEHFDQADGIEPAALRGVVVIDGGGDNAPKRAARLARLGFGVALFVDNDGALDPSDLAPVTDAGGNVVQTSTGHNLETEIAAALSLQALQEIVDLAISFDQSDDSNAAIRDAIQARLPGGGSLTSTAVAHWAQTCGEPAVRAAIGKAAADKKWFKNVSKGEQVGSILITYAGELAGTPVGVWIGNVRAFTHPTTQ